MAVVGADRSTTEYKKKKRNRRRRHRKMWTGPRPPAPTSVWFSFIVFHFTYYEDEISHRSRPWRSFGIHYSIFLIALKNKEIERWYS